MIFLLVVFAAAKPGPVGQIDPLPIVKPVLIDPYTWSMYGKVVAYYYQVRMPDGTTQQLKIKSELGKAAPTLTDWQAKADAAWLARPDPNNVPKTCPYCGGTGVLP